MTSEFDKGGGGVLVLFNFLILCPHRRDFNILWAEKVLTDILDKNELVS